eukprot:TRINITY_DN569_c0_g1_i10.p1 TRINITY_DN569_c0_g1~~TRINITY_DN569_c0_g1_i10.p1  ORF type:complete len:2448 (-),score=333.89 TRINITY_DN569_c0_g1_i10:328-7671(-)
MLNGPYQLGMASAPSWVTSSDTRYPNSRQYFDEAPSLRRHVAPRAASVVADCLGNILERWRTVDATLPYSLMSTVSIVSGSFPKLAAIVSPTVATRCPLLKGTTTTSSALNKVDAISVIESWFSGSAGSGGTYTPDTKILAAMDTAVAHYQRSYEVFAHTILATMSKPSLISTNLSTASQTALWGSAAKATSAKAATGRAPSLALASSVYAEASHCLSLTASLAAIAFEDEPFIALLPSTGTSKVRAPLPPTNPSLRTTTHVMYPYLLSDTYESNSSLIVQLSNENYEANMAKVNAKLQAAFVAPIEFAQAVSDTLIPLYEGEYTRLAARDRDLSKLTSSSGVSVLAKRWTVPIQASSQVAKAATNTLLCSLATVGGLSLSMDRILNQARVSADESFPSGSPSSATTDKWWVSNDILTTPINVSLLLNSQSRAQLITALGYASTPTTSPTARYPRTATVARLLRRLSTGSTVDCYSGVASSASSMFNPFVTTAGTKSLQLLQLLSDVDLATLRSNIVSTSTSMKPLHGGFAANTLDASFSSTPLVAPSNLDPTLPEGSLATTSAIATRDRNLANVHSLFAHMNPNTSIGKYVPNTTISPSEMLSDPSIGSRLTASELAAYLLTLPRAIPADTTGLGSVVVCPQAGYHRAVDPATGSYYCAQCFNTYPDFVYCPEGSDAQYRCENKPLSSADDPTTEIAPSGMLDYNDWISTVFGDEPLQNFRAGYVPQGRGWSSPACPFRCLNPSYYQLRSNESYLPEVDIDTLVSRPALCNEGSRKDSVLSLPTNLSSLSSSAQSAAIAAGTCASGNMGYARDYCAETPIGHYAEVDGATTFKKCALDGLGVSGDDLSYRWGKESPARLRAEDVVFSTSGRSSIPSSCGFQMRVKAVPVLLSTVPLVPGITSDLSVIHPMFTGTPIPLGLSTEEAVTQYVNPSSPLTTPFLALPYLAQMADLISQEALLDPLSEYDNAVGGGHVAAVREAIGEGLTIKADVQLSAAEINNAFLLVEESTDYSRIQTLGGFVNASTGSEDANQQSIAADLVAITTTDSVTSADFMGKRIWSLSLVLQRASKGAVTPDGAASYSPTTAFLLLSVNSSQIMGSTKPSALSYRSSSFLISGTSGGVTIDPNAEFTSFAVSIDNKEQLVYFLINDEPIPTGCMTTAQSNLASSSGFETSGTNFEGLTHMLPETRRCHTPNFPVPTYGEPFGAYPRSKRTSASALDLDYFKNFASPYLQVGGWMGYLDVLESYGTVVMADDHTSDVADLMAANFGRPVSTISLPSSPRTLLRNYTMFPGNITGLSVTPQRHIAVLAVQLEELGLLSPIEASVNANVWDHSLRNGVPTAQTVEVFTGYNGSKCGYGYIGSQCEVDCPAGSPTSTGDPTTTIASGCECLEVSRVLNPSSLACERTAPPFEAPTLAMLSSGAVSISAATSRSFQHASADEIMRHPNSIASPITYPPPLQLSTRSFRGLAAAPSPFSNGVYDDGYYHSPLEFFNAIKMSTAYEGGVPPKDWSTQSSNKASSGLATLRMKCGGQWVGSDSTAERLLWSMTDNYTVPGTLTPTPAVDPTSVGSASPLTGLRVLSPRPTTSYGSNVFTYPGSASTQMQDVYFQTIPFAAFYGENCTVYGRVQDSPSRRPGAVAEVTTTISVLAQASPVVPLHSMSLPNYTVISPIKDRTNFYNHTFFLRIRNYTLARLPLSATNGETNLSPSLSSSVGTTTSPASTNIFLSPNAYSRRVETNRALSRVQEAMKDVHFHVVATSSTYHPKGDPSTHYTRSPSPTTIEDVRLLDVPHFLFEKVFSASKLLTKAVDGTPTIEALSKFATIVVDPTSGEKLPVLEPFIDAANPNEIVLPFRAMTTLVSETTLKSALGPQLDALSANTTSGSSYYTLSEPPSAYRPLWVQVRVVSAAHAVAIDSVIKARTRASTAIPHTSFVDTARASKTLANLTNDLADSYLVNTTAFRASPWTSVVMYPFPFLPTVMESSVLSSSGSDFTVQTSASFALSHKTFVPWSWTDLSTNSQKIALNPERKSTTFTAAESSSSSGPVGDIGNVVDALRTNDSGTAAPLQSTPASISTAAIALLPISIVLCALAACVLGTLICNKGWIPYIGYICEDNERREYDVLTPEDVEALRLEVLQFHSPDDVNDMEGGDGNTEPNGYAEAGADEHNAGGAVQGGNSLMIKSWAAHTHQASEPPVDLVDVHPDHGLPIDGSKKRRESRRRNSRKSAREDEAEARRVAEEMSILTAASHVSRVSRVPSSLSRSRRRREAAAPEAVVHHDQHEEVVRASVRSTHRAAPRESINNDPFDTSARPSIALDDTTNQGVPVSRAASRQRSSSRRESTSSRRRRLLEEEDDLNTTRESVASSAPRPPGLPLGHSAREPVAEDPLNMTTNSRRSSSRRKAISTEPIVEGLNDSCLAAVPVAMSEERNEKSGRRHSRNRRPQG